VVLQHRRGVTQPQATGTIPFFHQLPLLLAVAVLEETLSYLAFQRRLQVDRVVVGLQVLLVRNLGVRERLTKVLLAARAELTPQITTQRVVAVLEDLEETEFLEPQVETAVSESLQVSQGQALQGLAVVAAEHLEELRDRVDQEVAVLEPLALRLSLELMGVSTQAAVAVVEVVLMEWAVLAALVLSSSNTPTP
jgi:hypothetical protein